MIFTNESGEKFEECLVDSRPEHIVIRPVAKPVKQEPKEWSYSLRWESNDKLPPDYFIDKEYILTEDQAQLIKEAVEALMEYVMGDGGNSEWTSSLTEPANKARQSMRENN